MPSPMNACAFATLLGAKRGTNWQAQGDSMDLCWQEQRGKARDPGEPAKAEGGRVKVLG